MAKSTEEILEEIKARLPDDWANMSPEHKLHFLIIAADEVLKPTGDYILLDASQTIRSFLTPEKPQGG